MRIIQIAIISFSLVATLMASEHPVPTNRSELNGADWFPYVMSKIAPLERWTFATSADDLRRADFQSKLEYETAIQDRAGFPAFCFSFFRPNPEMWRALLSAIEAQPGPVFWQFRGDCLVASRARSVLVAPTAGEEIASLMRQAEEKHGTSPDGGSSGVESLVADAPRFCQYLEQRLGLTHKEPQPFDSGWLAKTGLALHPAQYEDFLEPGDWSIALSKTPNLGSPEAVGDTCLHFGIPMSGTAGLLAHLGADWDKYWKSNNAGPIQPSYPLLSQFDDITADIVFQPAEVSSLIAECMNAQEKIDDPHSLRTLDKFLRAARWAEKLKAGLVFRGE